MQGIFIANGYAGDQSLSAGGNGKFSGLASIHYMSNFHEEIDVFGLVFQSD